MNLRRLRPALGAGLPAPVLLEETDSTNRVARELAARGAPHGTLVAADRQTAGRGRRGRTFFSPEGGIYMSLLLRPTLAPEELTLLTPMAAVAVSRTVDALCRVSTGIKWVNDILLDGKKLCGILTERCPDGAVVVGIGLNHRTPPGGFPRELEPIACALFPWEEEAEVSAEALCGGIVQEIIGLTDTVCHRAFLAEYREKSAILGREITVFPLQGEPFPALAEEIDDNGRLIVRTAAGARRVLSSGEVSVRME